MDIVTGSRAESSTRRRKQNGNTTLESALILTVTLLMFFGIVDVCFAVSLQSLFSNAAREGARFAVTFSPSYGGNSCATSQAGCITKVVQDNAVGFLAGAKSRYVVVNYYTANDLTNPIMTCNQGTCTQNGTLPQTLPNGRVVTYPNQPGNVIETRISSYPFLWLVPIYGAGSSVTDPITNQTGLGLTINTASADVLGGLAQGTIVPPAP